MNTFKEFNEDGTLKATGTGQNDLKEGKWWYYSKNGNVYKEVCFKNNVEHGEWKMWHANGNLYLEQNKVNGKSEGYWKEYYENGNLKETGEYRNGEYFPIDFWDESGKQLLKNGTGKKIEKFGNLELDIYEHYYENGRLIEELKISSAQYGGFDPTSNK